MIGLILEIQSRSSGARAGRGHSYPAVLRVHQTRAGRSAKQRAERRRLYGKACGVLSWHSETQWRVTAPLPTDPTREVNGSFGRGAVIAEAVIHCLELAESGRTPRMSSRYRHARHGRFRRKADLGQGMHLLAISVIIKRFFVGPYLGYVKR